MDNKITAQDIASYGRNGDTMLVHMTPDEVGGLQALAMSQGGSLTINPDTGLPEAGFLSDTFKAFLPTLIGAGVSIMSGGAIPAWAIGLGAGAIEAKRTGDLGRGLMAGLGAYGGAGLGQGLAASGAKAGASAGATGADYGGMVFDNVNNAGISSTTGAGSSTIGGRFADAGRGLKMLGSEGSTFGAEYAKAMQGPSIGGEALWSGGTGTKAATLGTLGNVAYRAGAFDQPEMAMTKPEESNYAGPYVPTKRTYIPQSREAMLAGNGREHQYFDVVNPAPGFESMNAARGGLLALNKMAGGRYLKGSGDGTSDSIPATIGQSQPARLADGEFVVDARTVSELGNGSSDAGARKLYAMMDNVHKARRNAERGKPSGADKYLKGLTATA
jgi:hypothetical protein